MALAVASGALRFMRPVSTLPAPISAKRSQPMATIAATHSRQRTVPVTCRTSRSMIAAGSLTRAAVTLATSGGAGGAMLMAARASAITSAAGPIRLEWKGAETGSSMPRFTPRALDTSMARSTAVRWPEITDWPPPLSLASSTASPWAASAQISAARSASAPSRAAMAPRSGGTASCIAWPRRRSSRAVTATGRAPAAVKALYSPKEWPATRATLSARRKPPSRSSTRTTAMETAISAGWALVVRVSSSAGPSKIRRESFCSSASSTS